MSIVDDSRPGRPSATRVPPHNLQAEESLLGAMLLSKEAVSIASETLTADNFYKPAHAHIFDAISSLAAVGEPKNSAGRACSTRSVVRPLS
jgi:replicative DNA helicase